MVRYGPPFTDLPYSTGNHNVGIRTQRTDELTNDSERSRMNVALPASLASEVQLTGGATHGP